jgi:heterodisulfide reductase subunit C
MDYLPNQVVHLVRLGLGQKALESAAIWLCASCETCTTRCPMGIDLAAVMDALRKEARAAGIVGGRVGVFHDTFLSSVKRYGRAHEIGLVGALKVKTKDFFSDLGLGVKMFLKGKFSLLPQRVKGIEQVREAFRK